MAHTKCHQLSPHALSMLPEFLRLHRVEIQVLGPPWRCRILSLQCRCPWLFRVDNSAADHTLAAVLPKLIGLPTAQPVLVDLIILALLFAGG